MKWKKLSSNPLYNSTANMCMKDNGRMAKKQEEAVSFGEMALTMKGIGLTIWQMDMGG